MNIYGYLFIFICSTKMKSHCDEFFPDFYQNDFGLTTCLWILEEEEQLRYYRESNEGEK